MNPGFLFLKPTHTQGQTPSQEFSLVLQSYLVLQVVQSLYSTLNYKLKVALFNTFRMSPGSYTAEHSIPPHTLARLARQWLEEDTPNFDPAGVCVGSQIVEARLLCKTPHSILAGSPFFTAVFAEVGCTVDWIYKEGTEIGEYSLTFPSRCHTNVSIKQQPTQLSTHLTAFVRA